MRRCAKMLELFDHTLSQAGYYAIYFYGNDNATFAFSKVTGEIHGVLVRCRNWP